MTPKQPVNPDLLTFRGSDNDIQRDCQLLQGIVSQSPMPHLALLVAFDERSDEPYQSTPPEVVSLVAMADHGFWEAYQQGLSSPNDLRRVACDPTYFETMLEMLAQRKKIQWEPFDWTAPIDQSVWLIQDSETRQSYPLSDGLASLKSAQVPILDQTELRLVQDNEVVGTLRVKRTADYRLALTDATGLFATSNLASEIDIQAAAASTAETGQSGMPVQVGATRDGITISIDLKSINS